MKFRMILLAVLVSAVVCVQARADFSQFGTFSVINGNSATGTYQVWDDFDGPDDLFTDPTPFPANDALLGIPADLATLDDPTADVYAELGVGDTGPVSGVWLGDGTLYATPQMRIVLDIPNIIDPVLTKIVQVTLRYQTQRLVGSGFVDAWLDPEETPDPEVGPQLDPVAGVETTVNDWTTLMLEWRFPQIFAGEEITILLHDSGVTLDSIIVETQCVPVPGAVLLGMLGLGYAGMKLRKYS